MELKMGKLKRTPSLSGSVHNVFGLVIIVIESETVPQRYIIRFDHMFTEMVKALHRVIQQIHMKIQFRRGLTEKLRLFSW